MPGNAEAPTKTQDLFQVLHPAFDRESLRPDELKRLNLIYETILATTDDFVYIFDPQGRFLFANPSLLTVWAKTLDQVIGKTCYDLGYPTWHADMHTREIEEIVRTKNQIRGEVPFTGESGIFGIYDYIFKPVLDSEGNVEIIVGTTRDVTERKRNEEKLQAAQAELQKRADELEARVAERTASLRQSIGDLESFSYSIVHDMRAPLRSMQGYAHILATDHRGALNAEGRNYLERIEKSAVRLDQLIRDVLTFSRASRADLKLEAVDTGALLRDILETYPDLLAQREQVHLLGEFPWVIGNEAALTQCFSNLLTNALKFAKPGQKANLRISSEANGNKVRINFRDDGVGIPPELQERIFELFQRVGNSGEGTGIGLPIVKKSIERMGGKVGVESIDGEGSNFWLELDLAPNRLAHK